MKRGTLNLLSGFLFMILVLGGYYYVWKTVSDSAPAPITSSTYIPVDVTSIKGQAETLTKARENNAGIPIPDPTEKMGKTNPFNVPE